MKWKESEGEIFPAAATTLSIQTITHSSFFIHSWIGPTVQPILVSIQGASNVRRHPSERAHASGIAMPAHTPSPPASRIHIRIIRLAFQAPLSLSSLVLVAAPPYLILFIYLFISALVVLPNHAALLLLFSYLPSYYILRCFRALTCILLLPWRSPRPAPPLPAPPRPSPPLPCHPNPLHWIEPLAGWCCGGCSLSRCCDGWLRR